MSEPIPLIHQTDLFRPHEDPDDHWDLASVYSLHLSGRFDLRGIVIDYPPSHHDGVPDAAGIEMLGEITGLSVPFFVGQKETMSEKATGSNNEAVGFIVRTLEASTDPVTFILVGSCRDVAIAGSLYPHLFEAKCRAVYLNAGTGYASKTSSDELEYNVNLDVRAYRAIFDLPCRVFWCPCFERLGVGMRLHEHGTLYSFEQADILPDLPQPLRGYFAYMYGRDRSPDWNRWLDPAIFRQVIDRQLAVSRSMWSTASILHAAGFEYPDAFVFEPVDVSCGEDGTTIWSLSGPESNIWKFRIKDHNRYVSAMNEALRSLMTELTIDS